MRPIAAATLAGAWFFQLVLDIRPCPLCLEQRYAYYLALPLGAAGGVCRRARGAAAGACWPGLRCLLLAALANAWLGGYHAGVEWEFWQGPTDCSGPVVDLGSAGTLLQRLDNVKVIRCDEVQWRFLGLSLAGYNVLISLSDGGDGRVGHRVGEAGVDLGLGNASALCALLSASSAKWWARFASPTIRDC